MFRHTELVEVFNYLPNFIIRGQTEERYDSTTSYILLFLTCYNYMENLYERQNYTEENWHLIDVPTFQSIIQQNQRE